MMKAVTPFLLLAGCAGAGPQQPAPPQAEGSYRALGTEPFWSVTIEGGTITYQPMEGARISVPAPMPRTTFNGHRYETQSLIVDVTHKACSDGMSDRTYSDTIMVLVNGNALHGCGGALLAQGE